MFARFVACLLVATSICMIISIMQGCSPTTPEPSHVLPHQAYENSRAYNESEARLFLDYGRVAFCSESAITTWSCGTSCNATRAPKVVRRFEQEDLQLAGYVALMPDGFRTGVPEPSCVAAFRGSVPGAANWVANLKFIKAPWPPVERATSWCKGCQAHRGFAGAYEAVRDDFLASVRALNCSSIFFVGHSLGGALATFASFDARAEFNVHVNDVYTFGAPRVGDEQFVKEYINAAIRQGSDAPMWRIVHEQDYVPRLPAHAWGFTHIPQEVFYPERDNFDKYIICQSTVNDFENKTCTWEMSIGEATGKFLVDAMVNGRHNVAHLNYLDRNFARAKMEAACTTEDRELVGLQ